ncbi:MAG: hypothetical protein IPG58_19835 [Acidobacteria bacterium]|nr:hypothetical protein [Acidobacteriota bacterium]
MAELLQPIVGSGTTELARKRAILAPSYAESEKPCPSDGIQEVTPDA